MPTEVPVPRNVREKSAAIDGDIERVAGRGHVALSELLENRTQRCTDTDLRRTAASERSGIDIGEVTVRRLEADGAAVGDVVADHIQRLGRGIKPAQTLLK